MYTKSDFKNATRLNKKFVNFQYIEGRPAINECNGDFDKILDYLCNLTAVLMTKVDIKDKDELINKISQRISEIYDIRKTAELAKSSLAHHNA